MGIGKGKTIAQCEAYAAKHQGRRRSQRGSKPKKKASTPDGKPLPGRVAFDWRNPPWKENQERKLFDGFSSAFALWPHENPYSPFYNYWEKYARSDFFPQTRHYESLCFKCYEEVGRRDMIACTRKGCYKVYHHKCAHLAPMPTPGGTYEYECPRHTCCGAASLHIFCSTCTNSYCDICCTSVLKVGEEMCCPKCREHADKIGAAHVLIDMRNTSNNNF